jgi:hypothetical protein
MATSFIISGKSVYPAFDMLKGINKDVVLWSQGKKILLSAYDNKGNVISITLNKSKDIERTPLQPILITLEAIKAICKGRGDLTFNIDRDITVTEKGTNFKTSNFEFVEYNGESLAFKSDLKYTPMVSFKNSLNNLKTLDDLITISSDKDIISALVIKPNLVVKFGIPNKDKLDLNCAISSFALNIIDQDLEMAFDKTFIYIKNNIMSGRLGVLEPRIKLESVNSLLSLKWMDIITTTKEVLLKGLSSTSGKEIVLSSLDGKLLLTWKNYGRMKLEDTVNIEAKMDKKVILNLKDLKAVLKLVDGKSKLVINTDPNYSKVLIKSKGKQFLLPTLYGG